MTRSNSVLQGLFELMMQTRALDKVLGAHDGHWHGLEGEEAMIAGVYYGLRQGDVVAPHYRGAVSASLAKGADLKTIMAGCLGRSTAYHKGRHRSDICGPPEFGQIGLYAGSLGPPLGYAAGAALAAKLDGRDDIAIGVFGDGSSSRGDCHEAMNFAAVLNLPMIFVCQDNQIAISTTITDGVAGSVAARGASFGLPSSEVDGNDVIAVRDAMDAAVARARSGNGPSVIHCKSFRVAGHFYSDAEDYRSADEVARWREKDPITRFRSFLAKQGVLTDQEMDEIETRVLADVDTAFSAAKTDPAPEAAALAADRVFAEATR